MIGLGVSRVVKSFVTHSKAASMTKNVPMSTKYFSPRYRPLYHTFILFARIGSIISEHLPLVGQQDMAYRQLH